MITTGRVLVARGRGEGGRKGSTVIIEGGCTGAATARAVGRRTGDFDREMKMRDAGWRLGRRDVGGRKAGEGDMVAGVGRW